MAGNGLFDGQRVLVKTPAGRRAGLAWDAMEFFAVVHGSHTPVDVLVRVKTDTTPAGSWMNVPRQFVHE